MTTTRARSRSSRGARGGRGGQRRQSIWQGSTFGPTSLAVSSILVASMIDVPGQLTYVDGTVVRIRGAIAARTETGAFIGRLAMGVMVISDEAFNAGGASIPNPDIDTAGDWMYHRFAFLMGGGGSGFEQMLQIEVDNKAMRRLPGANKHLVFVLVNTSASEVLEVAGAFRSLVKLH